MALQWQRLDGESLQVESIAQLIFILRLLSKVRRLSNR